MIADVAGLGSYLAQASFFGLSDFGASTTGAGVLEFGILGSRVQGLGTWGLWVYVLRRFTITCVGLRGSGALGVLGSEFTACRHTPREKGPVPEQRLFVVYVLSGLVCPGCRPQHAWPL